MITPTMQELTALFWTATALVGVTITLPVLVVGWRVWRRWRADAGLAIMALSHVQADLLRLLMHGSFFVLGLARLLGPPFAPLEVPSALAYWLGVGALMLVPLELIAVTLLGQDARRRVHESRFGGD